MSSNIPSDGVIVKNAKLAVSRELNKKKALNQPIAKFDAKSKKVYIEHGDGNITIVGEATRGRYSERQG